MRPGVFVPDGMKVRKAVLMVVLVEPRHVAGQRRRQAVLDVEARPAAEGDGKFHGPVDAQLVGVAVNRDVAFLVHRRHAAALHVLQNARVVFVHAEERHAAIHGAGHGIHQVVVGIEHGPAAFAHRAGQHALHGRHVLHGVDVAQAQVVGGHVGHHGHVAGVEAQAGAQHAAPRRFQHGVVDGGVAQHELGALAAGAVARSAAARPECRCRRWS